MHMFQFLLGAVMNFNQMQDKAKKISDSGLASATSLAVFLIVKRDFSLKQAIASSVKHYKVKAHIEKELRAIFPVDYFLERSKQTYRSSFDMTSKDEAKGQAILTNQLNRQTERHMAEIRKVA